MELPEPFEPTGCLPWEAETELETAENDLPGVSVVMPVFNAAEFLERTIRSLLMQDLNGIELIFMDGGSTDNTKAIAEHYRSYFANMTFEPDEGQSDAINKGFSKATQPILYWLNGDDIILPNAITKVRRTYRDNPGVQVVVGDAYMTEANFAAINHFQFKPEKLKFEVLLDYASNHLIQPSVFFSREAWDNAGPLKNELHFAMDADLFLAMASKYELHHLPLDLSYSVYHENCKTRDKRAESITELALVQARHGGHAEARKSLNILVDLFNQTEEELSAAQNAYKSVSEGGSYVNPKILERKLEAMSKEHEANKRLMIDQDLLETRTS